MANVISSRNGLNNGIRNIYDVHVDENQSQSLGKAASLTANNDRSTTTWRTPPQSAPTRKTSTTSNAHPPTSINGNAASHSDEDIPENMYRPDKDDPEGWIHRDKLAKIESEELQAAGINLANARSRSQNKLRGDRSQRDSDVKRDEKRQRLQSPVEIEEEVERAQWDLRSPEEIDADNHAASQMYSNPVLRKSGSKIPVMTSSPLPIPAERYERDTPIARKRTASGSISLEGDLNVNKLRSSATNTFDDSDAASSAVASSKPGSPQKSRSKSATLSPSSKPTNPATRKISAPPRATPSPNQRPPTRSGEQDRPRTSINRPEGDPPWLATMYKPDPRLPPDQQLIPTLAKKQMQAQWAEEGAVPKTYDREFAPIAVHDQLDASVDDTRPARSSSPTKPLPSDELLQEKQDDSTFPLKPLPRTNSNNGRPGTSGSASAGYSTMPKVLNPLQSQPEQKSPGLSPVKSRPTNAPAPQRLQAQSLAIEDDEKVKKGCGCCIVM